MNKQDPVATPFPSDPIGRIQGSTTQKQGHVAVNPSIPYRMHGDPHGHVLVYLPGLHGDFTLVRSFRERILPTTAFVEFAYPVDGNPSPSTRGCSTSRAPDSHTTWHASSRPGPGPRIAGSGPLTRVRPRRPFNSPAPGPAPEPTTSAPPPPFPSCPAEPRGAPPEG